MKTTSKIRIKSCSKVTLVTKSYTMQIIGTCRLPLTIAGVNAISLFQFITMKKKEQIRFKDAIKLKLVHELNDNHGAPLDVYYKNGKLLSDLL